MKKLLIATTALVATAGMASADITISGHAAAGIYSGLDSKAASNGVIAAATGTALTAATSAAATTQSTLDTALSTLKTAQAAVVTSPTAAATAAAAAAQVAYDAAYAADVAADIVVNGKAAVPMTPSGDGIYSNAGVDFTMTGATDNGISFSASVNIDAGTEIDAGDFELDGPDSAKAGLGSVSMSGTFGTLTFDDGGIENLYSDGLSNADVSYSTTVGAVSLTVAHDTAAASTGANSVSAGYTASGMAFTLTASEAAAGTSASLAVSYALNDSVTISADTDQAAGAESVQTIGAKTTLNGVSVSVESANNSTWDVDLGYTAGGFALTYGVDETDGWTATATSALGGGATFAAGVNSEDSMYAGVSFAF
ncbi:porin [Amylibacter sp.]|nr:porin [Amylibacter sp.]